LPDTSIPTSRAAVSRNPATGEVIERFPFQTDDEIQQLLKETSAAYQVWRATPLPARVKVYFDFARRLRARSNLIAPVITAEMGKISSEAVAEVEKCAAAAEWFAEHGPSLLADEAVEVPGGDRVYVSYRPIGAVLGIMPWNLPVWQAMRACVPIMLSGNAFILKPAPNTMRCAYLLQDDWQAAGLPKGLLSILNTDNDGIKKVLEDRRVVAVTLTGGTKAGSAVAALAGKLIKRSLLELGGADPFIVLADADIDKAVAVGIIARFSNSGQVCLAAKRFILEEPIAEQFTKKFVESARKLKTGDPLDPATNIGPQAREDLRAGIHDQVTRSVASGATLLLGGHVIEGPGFFYEPTVLSGVEPGMAAFDEEIFGPVAALITARDADHAIELANNSDYGLSGNLWTSDIARGEALASRMETGGVFINGYTASNPRLPVGGVKNSGYGRELSHFGVREFTNAQGVWVKQL
jgi:succinate-semialdehyde dehydrogenase